MTGQSTDYLSKCCEQAADGALFHSWAEIPRYFSCVCCVVKEKAAFWTKCECDSNEISVSCNNLILGGTARYCLATALHQTSSCLVYSADAKQLILYSL